ncbi:unnamed protein product [Coregonus sp. 'balchen']|nr:unnamed protein product [Coregonus sp. 'balchen']
MARNLFYRAAKVVQLSMFTRLARSRSLCTQTPAEPLTVRRQNNGIRSITLNNPKKRNALSLSMLDSLRGNILADIDSDDLRVIVISAKGPVFSSGHDLKELTSAQGRDYHTKVMTLIQDIPVPVIAMVNGVATAAGCQLVASCDIAVVTERSTFATPGVNVGLFCSTPAVAIGRAVPKKVHTHTQTDTHTDRQTHSV